MFAVVERPAGTAHQVEESRDGAAEGPSRTRERKQDDGDHALPAAPGTATVLIVDDDPVVLQALSDDLEQARYRLITAESGRECLAMLQRHSVDVVVLDLMMPDVSGFDVLGRITESPELRHLPVLVLSARGQEAVRALKAGAVDYLTKPWQPEELLARVGTHVRLRQRETELGETVLRLDQRTRDLENEILERKRAEAQLIMASRMSSVGVVAAGVAHEINNPLTYLIGNLDIIRQRLHDARATISPPDVETMAHMADQASEGAERVRLIVRDLKAFSRPDSEELEAVSLIDVLDSVLRLAGHEIKHRAMVVRDEVHVPAVVGNVARLSQVLLNVVANAAQAMEHGSPERDSLRISAQLSSDATMVEVRLADSGVGMDARSLAHAFDLFYTTKRANAGTGLGLPLCRKIVEGFGGRIAITSELGRGTEVTIHLPVHQSQITGTGASVGTLHELPRRPHGRVLVIDDEPEIGSLIAAMLQDSLFVEVTHGANEALACLRGGTTFDVILCDLMMGGGSGMDVFEVVAQEFPHLSSHMLFMTGGPCTARAAAFLEQHAERVLEKPFSLRQLESALDKARQA